MRARRFLVCWWYTALWPLTCTGDAYGGGPVVDWPVPGPDLVGHAAVHGHAGAGASRRRSWPPCGCPRTWTVCLACTAPSSSSRTTKTGKAMRRIRQCGFGLCMGGSLARSWSTPSSALEPIPGIARDLAPRHPAMRVLRRPSRGPGNARWRLGLAGPQTNSVGQRRPSWMEHDANDGGELARLWGSGSLQRGCGTFQHVGRTGDCIPEQQEGDLHARSPSARSAGAAFSLAIRPGPARRRA